jgi:hypothetical protein
MFTYFPALSGSEYNIANAVKMKKRDNLLSANPVIPQRHCIKQSYRLPRDVPDANLNRLCEVVILLMTEVSFSIVIINRDPDLHKQKEDAAGF